MATMKGKRILTSLYIEPEVHAALKRLSEETRVPIAVYLREAVGDLLAKYRVPWTVKPVATFVHDETPRRPRKRK